MCDLKKWCMEILPVVQAGAEGMEIQVSNGDGNWHNKGARERSFCAGFNYRIKPMTINVNGFEIQEPMRNKPKGGEKIHIVTMYSNGGLPAIEMLSSECYWCDSENQNFWLNNGLIHATKESAIAHSKAMLGIDPNKKD